MSPTRPASQRCRATYDGGPTRPTYHISWSRWPFALACLGWARTRHATLGQISLCPATPSWLGHFPAIPHWKSPIVPCPSKIMLSNTTSALSIKKACAPIRALRSKSRPFVVVAKLSVPITFRDYSLPMSHPVPPEVSVCLSGSFAAETISRGDRSLEGNVPVNGVSSASA